MHEELAEAAQQQVAEWRRKGELYLPGFPEQKKFELRNSLSYPQEGSARGEQAKPG